MKWRRVVVALFLVAPVSRVQAQSCPVVSAPFRHDERWGDIYTAYRWKVAQSTLVPGHALAEPSDLRSILDSAGINYDLNTRVQKATLLSERPDVKCKSAGVAGEFFAGESIVRGADRASKGVPDLRLGLSGTVRTRLAVGAEAEMLDGDVSLSRFSVIAAPFQNLRLGVVRDRYLWGDGVDGSSTLGGNATLTAFTVETPQWFSVPHTGQWGGQLLLSRLDTAGIASRPWFGAMRVDWRIRQSWSLAFNHAVFFGGTSDAALIPPLTVHRVFNLLTGRGNTYGVDSATGEGYTFENHVASMELNVHGTIQDQAVAVYAELGQDDKYGWRRQPATIFRLSFPFWLGNPGHELSVERVGLGAGYGYGLVRQDATNTGAYYHHPSYGDYVVDGQLVGHPLGGNGRRLLVQYQSWSQSGTQSFSVRMGAEYRDPQNTLAPALQGHSDFAGIRIGAPINEAARLVLDGSVEKFPSFTTFSMSLGVDVRRGAGRISRP